MFFDLGSGAAVGWSWEVPMTITIDIRPEVQAELARQAASRGSGIEEVCAMVRGLTDDVDFSRNPSAGRPVNL